MVDVKKFSSELQEEVKGKFPQYFEEAAEFTSKLTAIIAVVAAIAIEKYDRERGD